MRYVLMATACDHWSLIQMRLGEDWNLDGMMTVHNSEIWWPYMAT